MFTFMLMPFCHIKIPIHSVVYSKSQCPLCTLQSEHSYIYYKKSLSSSHINNLLVLRLLQQCSLLFDVCMSSVCGRGKGCVCVCWGGASENPYGCLKLQMAASPRCIVCFFLYVCPISLPLKTGVSLPPCFMPWYPNPVSLLLYFTVVIKTVRVTWKQIPWSDITTAKLIIDLTNRRVASTAWILWTKGWFMSWVWTKRDVLMLLRMMHNLTHELLVSETFHSIFSNFS